MKLFIHVTQAEQDERLRERLDNPWKRWKTGRGRFPQPREARRLSGAIDEMFAHTDTRWAPWTVIDGNDKKAARIAALTRVAEALGEALPKEPPPIPPEIEKLARQLKD